MKYLVAKRVLDIFLSLFGLLFLSPVMFLIAIAIKFESTGPLFYRGERTGKNGVIFKIFKFRSMVLDAEKKGGFSTALNDHRLTRIGRFLRRYKLDEFPQLFNVLIGEMAIVGPRPQVSFYTDLYTTEELIILSVRPGVTDLASLYFYDMDSVLGSENVDKKYLSEIEPIKNRLRLRYVREISFYLDFRILIETIFKIIRINHSTGLKIMP
jgi:lipopolysaccharide/colanic/teichoic acid biosynthesis glycosyltransferase